VNADDRRLIEDCLHGRTEAFGDLVRRYQSRLYNSVYRILDNADDAQDVVQDAFLNAYQSLDASTDVRNFYLACTGLHLIRLSAYGERREWC